MKRFGVRVPAGVLNLINMAKQQTSTYVSNNVKRKGVHAKTKQSKNKNSKNYKKPYASQGR